MFTTVSIQFIDKYLQLILFTKFLLQGESTCYAFIIFLLGKDIYLTPKKRFKKGTVNRFCSSLNPRLQYTDKPIQANKQLYGKQISCIIPRSENL